MASVVWRSRATRHLEEIYGYIRDRNPEAAERYASELRQACSTLEDFPERARRYDDRYRVLVFRNHLVFYRYDAAHGRIYVTAILDARQDPERIARIVSRI